MAAGSEFNSSLSLFRWQKMFQYMIRVRMFEVCLSFSFFPCSLPSLMLLNMLAIRKYGNTVKSFRFFYIFEFATRIHCVFLFYYRPRLRSYSCPDNRAVPEFSGSFHVGIPLFLYF